MCSLIGPFFCFLIGLFQRALRLVCSKYSLLEVAHFNVFSETGELAFGENQGGWLIASPVELNPLLVPPTQCPQILCLE